MSETYTAEMVVPRFDMFAWEHNRFYALVTLDKAHVTRNRHESCHGVHVATKR